MFPDIDAEDGGHTLADRVVLVGRGDDLQRATINHEPTPAAAELATRSPEVLRDAKRLVDETWAAAPGDGLKLEAELQAKIIASPNQVEAVMANVQKRKPVFK